MELNIITGFYCRDVGTLNVLLGVFERDIYVNTDVDLRAGLVSELGLPQSETLSPICT